jgi:hypothetical protein
VTERSEDTSAAVIARVLRRTGLGFPRGVVDAQTARLAALLDQPDLDPGTLDAQVSAATLTLWGDLQPPIVAAVLVHLSRADGQDQQDLERVLAWAERDDPDNPLARALTVRAAQELGTAVRYAEDQMRAAEAAVAMGGPAGALAAARALGAAVVALLDVDPEDFAAEIVDYIDDDQSAEALDELARITGDPETRLWARAALAALELGDAPAATLAVHALAAGEPPEDPAADAVWVPAILALVEEGLERALAQEVEDAE